MQVTPLPTESLAGSELILLDQLTSALWKSLEVQYRLDAILEFFVPRFADWALITMPEDSGDARIAARRGAQPAKAGLAHTTALPLVTNDAQVGTLHVCFNERGPQAGQFFLRTVVERCAQALRNAMLYEREQHVALTFQNAALSAALPDVPGYHFDAVYEAGRAEALVGGDWYDAFALYDGRFVVSIGDVVGSGLRAAVAMVNVRQTMRGVAYVHPDPVIMLEAAGKALRDQYPERYVTTFVAVIDPVTQSCTYANAGHPPPFLRSADGHVEQLRGNGVPLGLSDFGGHAQVHYSRFEPGSLLLLYTDGLTEASRDILEGERRVRTALEQLDPGDETAAHTLHECVLSNHASDDVAILAIHAASAPPVNRWRFDPRWPDATARLRLEISDELVRAQFEPELLFNLEVIFAELVANVLRYAPGTVEAFLEVRPDAFIFHLADKGPGFQFLPRLPQDLFSENGRGLFLISQLAAEFNVEHRPGGGSHARVVLANRKRSIRRT